MQFLNYRRFRDVMNDGLYIMNIIHTRSLMNEILKLC